MNRRLAAFALMLPLAGCAVGRTITLPSQLLPADAASDPSVYILVTVPNPVGPLPSRAGSTPRGYDDSPVYSAGRAARAAARSIAADYGLVQVSAWPIATLHVHCIMYRVDAAEHRAAIISRLTSDPRVRLAQPLNAFATSATAYDDQYLGLQRSFDEMSVAAAHQWSQGAGVTVAVIDTGIDLDHPDLAGRIRASRNFVDHDGRRFTGDRHGTEVAGVIAAVGNNGRGIVGVAPRVELLALKACWQPDEQRDAAVCNSYTLAQAIVAAIEARADIINLSLVGPADPLLASLVENAIDSGTIVVGSVPASGRQDGFPVVVRGVLAVAMTEAPASNGALQAPGYEVLTLVPHDRYDFATGSSLSTANVSGVVALLRSKARDIGAFRAATILTRSSREISGPDPDSPQQSRSVDACAALALLLARTGCPAAEPVTSSAPTRLQAGQAESGAP